MDEALEEVHQAVFRFDYVLSKDEYIAFNLYTYIRSEFHRRRTLGSRLGTAICVSSLAGALYHIHFENWYFTIAGFVIAAVCGWVLSNVFWRWQIGRIYTQDKTLQAPSTVEVADPGVSVARGGARSFLPWTSIIKVAETDQAIYLYLNTLQALIFPRRIFADSAAFAALGRFVSGKVVG